MPCGGRCDAPLHGTLGWKEFQSVGSAGACFARQVDTHLDSGIARKLGGNWSKTRPTSACRSSLDRSNRRSTNVSQSLDFTYAETREVRNDCLPCRVGWLSWHRPVLDDFPHGFKQVKMFCTSRNKVYNMLTRFVHKWWLACMA
eukprot:4068204-Pyramimonas_sp.AAC.2